MFTRGVSHVSVCGCWWGWFEAVNSEGEADRRTVTPDDIAEIIVFMAGRRENVVIADSLVFPSHQVRKRDKVTQSDRYANGDDFRARQQLCTGSHRCAKISDCTLPTTISTGCALGILR